MQIRKAQRASAKARITLAGPSKSGKSYGALLLASGMGKKIGLIDTENGQGEIYSDEFEYDVISLRPPYTVQSYIDAINMFDKNGYDVIIVDSLSHAWFAEGGLLEKTDQAAQQSKSNNTYFAWRASTEDYNKLIQAIQNSDAHIVGTMRTKTEYALESADGKVAPKKIGLKPIMRADFEYEFTINIDVDLKHNVSVQSRAGKTLALELTYKELTPAIGKQIADWFGEGRMNWEPVWNKLSLALQADAKADISEFKDAIEAMKTESPDRYQRLQDFLKQQGGNNAGSSEQTANA